MQKIQRRFLSAGALALMVLLALGTSGTLADETHDTDETGTLGRLIADESRVDGEAVLGEQILPRSTVVETDALPAKIILDDGRVLNLAEFTTARLALEADGRVLVSVVRGEVSVPSTRGGSSIGGARSVFYVPQSAAGAIAPQDFTAETPRRKASSDDRDPRRLVDLD